MQRPTDYQPTRNSQPGEALQSSRENELQIPALQRLRALVAEKRPSLETLMQSRGHLTVQQYTKELLTSRSVETIDRKDDVVDVASEFAKRIYGEEIANQVRQRLTAFHVINTGPHDGVDTFPLTYQGRLFGALGEQPVTNADGTITQPLAIIMPCGGVPMNNVSRPMGLIVDEAHKINIFTNSAKDTSVHVAPAFTEEMIANAQQSIMPPSANLRNRSGVVRVELPEKDRENVDRILRDMYKDPLVLAQTRYVDQAALLNKALWEQTFHPEARGMAPQLVSLEQETITAGLLEKDLAHEDSFISAILFNGQVRQSVLAALEGIPGCWRNTQWMDSRPNGEVITRYGLTELADTNLPISPEKRREDAEKAMTHFFWGIDAKGKSYPLAIADANGQTVLRRVDKLHTTEDIPFTKEAILQGLADQTLMPSLMVTFGVLQFARAYNCLGGFMQEEYLTNMGRGLQYAFQQTRREEWAQKVAQARKTGYAVGMPLVITRDQSSGNLRMAGPLDMIKHGGITQEELTRIQDITLQHEYMMGLPSIARIILGSSIDADLLSKAQQEVDQLWEKYLVEI